MSFIRVTKHTPEHGMREYYIDIDQIAMVNTGQMAEHDPDITVKQQPRRADEGVIWLKGSQVFVACDQTTTQIMQMLDGLKRAAK